MIQTSKSNAPSEVFYMVLSVNLEYNDEYYYETDGYNPGTPAYQTLDEAKAAAKLALKNQLNGMSFEDFDEGFWMDEPGPHLTLFRETVNDDEWALFSDFITWCEDTGRNWVPEVPALVSILEVPIKGKAEQGKAGFFHSV